jgi:hypothetical protein
MPAMRLTTFSLVLAAALGPAGAARAQLPPPKFEYSKPPDKPADWKVIAKGGLLVTTGNSQSRNGNLTLTGSRQDGQNKLTFDGTVAYGRSQILIPVLDAMGNVAGLARQAQTTTNQWRTRGRYDRFFTSNNAAYLLAQIGADRVAGKRLVGGGQLGYSRHLISSEVHTAVAELGYDLSHESYFAQADRTLPSVTIHSARLFVGELAKLTADTAVTGSVEALLNLNKETAPDASDPTGARNEVDPLHDTRITGKIGLTTTLYKNLAFAVGFTLAYDQNPAPRPVPPGAGGGKYAPDFHPFAESFDTLTEATLVFTFL